MQEASYLPRDSQRMAVQQWVLGIGSLRPAVIRRINRRMASLDYYGALSVKTGMFQAFRSPTFVDNPLNSARWVNVGSARLPTSRGSLDNSR